MEAPDQADVDEDSNTSELVRLHFHSNSLGSVAHLTDPDEDVVEQYEYSPYGEPTVRDGAGGDLSGESAVGNPYLFTARRLDEESGLFHYRARSYDPVVGRFLQRDPARYLDGPNLLEYCGSSPIARCDPTGEAWSWPLAGVGALVGGVGGLCWGLGHEIFDVAQGGTWDGEYIGKATLCGAGGGFVAGGVTGAVTGDPTALAAAGAAGFTGGALDSLLTPPEKEIESERRRIIHTAAEGDDYGKGGGDVVLTDGSGMRG